MEWKYNESGNCWSASKPMSDGVCDFIYTISKTVCGGYVAEAKNNAYGACRVAVEDEYCEEQSVFYNLDDLMKQIDDGNIYWLYTSHCNCIGEVTKEER